jgi:cation diffusion facilitator family transporter
VPRISKGCSSYLGPTQIAFWAAVVSIIVNEIIFRVTLFIARTERSKVLEANAWHHRSDALSSLAALAGISGSMIGYPFADPLAGLVVSAMIVHAGWTVLREVVYELTDKQTDTAVRSQVIALLNELKNDQKNQIKGFHSLRLRKMGPYIVADLYITVDPNLKVSEGSKIADAVRDMILQKIPKLQEVVVHFRSSESEEH